MNELKREIYNDGFFVDGERVSWFEIILTEHLSRYKIVGRETTIKKFSSMLFPFFNGKNGRKFLKEKLNRLCDYLNI